MPPQGAGFFSARAANLLPEGHVAGGLPINSNLPAFNPQAESPSIRKTPGIDHKTTKPLTRDLRHVTSSSQATSTTNVASVPRPNLVNPQLDATRRIGAPGSPSPMASRGSYKPPTLKRPVDDPDIGANGSRLPLADLPANGPIGIDDPGYDAKRQRLDA